MFIPIHVYRQPDPIPVSVRFIMIEWGDDFLEQLQYAIEPDTGLFFYRDRLYRLVQDVEVK
jgi:hypothetical protein